MNRRRFIKYGVVTSGAIAAAGGAWFSFSNQRSARWARRIATDARRAILPSPHKPEPATWKSDGVTLAWLGHATVLINFYGINILTDPALGSRVGVSLGLWTAGPKRYIAPALRFKDLPPIDLVILSHAHMDHMDMPTLNRFPRETQVVTARSTRDILEGTRLNSIHELGWDESRSIDTAAGSVEVRAIQVKHWGVRWPSEKERGYNGYVLSREGKRLLFGGDTAYVETFRPLRGLGPIQAAIMPVGAYRPWIWNHCSPEEALDMANEAGAEYIIPVHHKTFKLSDEPMEEPVERLTAALRGETQRLALTDVGQTFRLPV